MGEDAIITGTCSYLYVQFKALEQLIEAVKELALQSLNVINALLDAIFVLARDVLNALIDTILAMIATLYDMINNIMIAKVNSFLGKTVGKIPVLCGELWRCTAFVKQLIEDPYIRKLFEQTGSDQVVEDIKVLASDFNKFREGICGNMNFSIDFGLSYVKKTAVWLKKQVDEIYDLVERWKLKISNKIVSYLDYLDGMGIAELVGKLEALATCVFSVDSDTCTSLQTSKNYAQDLTRKLCFEKKEDNSLEFTGDRYNKFMKSMEGMTSTLKTADEKLDKLVEIMNKPLNTATSAGAYNLNKDLMKMGTWAKNGFKMKDLKKIPLVAHTVKKWDTLVDDWNKLFGDNADAEKVIQNSKVKDDGTIEFENRLAGNMISSVQTEVETFDAYVDPSTDTAIESSLMVEESTGEIISAAEAARRCFLYELDPEKYAAYKSIYDQCRRSFELLNGPVAVMEGY